MGPPMSTEEGSVRYCVIHTSCFWRCSKFVILAAMLLAINQTSRSAPNDTSTMAPATASDVTDLASCVPNASAGYPHGKSHQSKCVIKIDRNDPVTPPTYTVPTGTEVYIELLNTRPNENVTFALASTKVAPHDIPSSALQNLIPGLQVITATHAIAPKAVQADRDFAPITVPSEVNNLKDSVTARQNEVIGSTNTVLLKTQAAAQAMICLSQYQVAVERVQPNSPDGSTVPSKYTCSQAAMLDRTSFQSAKDSVIALANNAATLPLRLLDVSDLDTVVKSFYLTCVSYFPDMAQRGQEARDACRSAAEIVSSQEQTLDTAISDIQKGQDALLQAVQALSYAVPANDTIVYKFTSKRLVNMVVTITGVEVVNKISSPIATVTINNASTAWVVSAGIEFSNLKLNTYTPAPVIMNGQPVLDPTGSPKTTVFGSSSNFSVIAPAGLVSYRINSLSRFHWQNRCPNGCAFLISGGVGANLTTKAADFDIGPSFQIGGVLITPTLHYGQDTRLIDGLAVGQPLGTNPPSTLPTTTKFVFKGGIAITYTIPIP
jgi:hypothetical protein